MIGTWAIALSVAALGQIEPLAGLIPILTAGLLVAASTHGAADHLLCERSDARFVVAYLGAGGAVALGWWIAPGVTLALFLFGSAWHFGRTDLRRATARPLLWLSRGAVVLAAPIALNTELTAPILAALGVPWRPGIAVAIAAWGVHLSLVLAMLPGRAALWEIGDVAVLGLVAWALPPVPAFVIYFVLWHTRRHVHDVWATVRRAGGRGRALLWMFAVGGAVAVGVGLVWAPRDPAFWAPAFVALAMLTLPHAIVVERWHGAD
ncbi:MAG: Brp/Blh family beta-carotene 15,15'-monooxygenase [Bradymonadia bacterium]